jgi:hypothetical protein
MTTERLFDPPGPKVTPDEAKACQKATQRAQETLELDDAPAVAHQCPACAGIDDACTCARTGAEATGLEL